MIKLFLIKIFIGLTIIQPDISEIERQQAFTSLIECEDYMNRVVVAQITAQSWNGPVAPTVGMCVEYEADGIHIKTAKNRTLH